MHVDALKRFTDPSSSFFFLLPFPRIFLIFRFLFKRRIEIDRAIDLETSWNKHLDRPIIFHSALAQPVGAHACFFLLLLEIGASFDRSKGGRSKVRRTRD